MSWGDPEDFEMCRRCEAAYSENADDGCRYHPERLNDGVWDCCRRDDSFGCTPCPHVPATEDEAAAIRAAKRARREPRDMAAEAAGQMADEYRCLRCETRYRTSENGANACRYHPGRMKDYDRYNAPGDGFAGDFWDCCSYTLKTDFDMSHGCALGWHVPIGAGQPGPLSRRYEAQPANEAALLDAFERKVGADGTARVSHARRLVEEFLAGLRPGGLQELNDEDIAVLEGPSLAWLIARVRKTQYPAERRRAMARLVKDPEMRVDLIRLVG